MIESKVFNVAVTVKYPSGREYQEEGIVCAKTNRHAIEQFIEHHAINRQIITKTSAIETGKILVAV